MPRTFWATPLHKDTPRQTNLGTTERRDVIERLPRLRFIASTGLRNVSIDMAAVVVLISLF
jgi:hypothetical protein